MRSPDAVVFGLLSIALSACASNRAGPVAPRAERTPPSTAAPAPAPAPAAPSETLAAPAPSVPPSPTTTLHAAPPASAPLVPPALRKALDAAGASIDTGAFTAADQELAAADRLAQEDAHLRYLVARERATRFAASGEFDRAAAALLAVLPSLVEHPELPDEFWSHNAMMMIREAEGDPAAALAEDDQATLCAERGAWDPQGRAKLAFQKDRWHRAYLTRMLAESRTGSVKQALVQYAERALDDYRTQGFPESVAVLEAYFAALDGKGAAALEAARRVDPAKDDDVEDLYLVVVGLEAGGDHAGAEAVRRVMRQPDHARISRAIMLRWLDLDAGPPGRGFTPRRAGARR